MKATFVICCIRAVALASLSCAPEAAPSILVTEDSLLISVTEVDGGIIIENLSSVACIVFVDWPDREHRFELAVGGSATVSETTKPIEVAAIGF